MATDIFEIIISLIFSIQLNLIICEYNGYKYELACREDNPEYLHYPGDVLLGGLFPIHQRPVINKGILQEPQLTSTGYKLLEAMLYAIDDINSRKNYLNFSLGALIFDTCQDPDNAFMQTLRFIVYDDPLENHTFKFGYRKRGTQKTMETYVLAVVGGSKSDVSISAANMLKFLDIPQISYLSSSSQLDDADKYQYFMRTVPSISMTTNVIIELLRQYKWFYVNVVLDSSEHGESNYGVFMEKLNQFSQTICVAKDVRLITYPLDSKDIGRRLKTLLDSPASVNILLVTSDTARLAISELLKWNQTDLDRFLWIGTNGFISTFKDLYLTDYLNPTSEKYFHGFKKFILVLPHLTEVENMKNYSINLKRTFNLTSWTSTYLLQFCGCLLNEVDLHNSTGQVCNINDEHKCISYLYGDSIYYVPQVVNAVYAIANALRQIFIQYPMLKWHHTSSEQMRRLLLNKLQKSQFEGFGKELFTFYDKRNGQPNFTILTFVSSELKWKVLGQYDASRSPSFYYINENISSYIYETIPESVCSKPCKSGQIKRIDWGRSCCWICINCSSQQIVTSENTETTHNKTENDIYKNHSSLPMCQFCNPGYRPNKNQTKCQMLPIKYMSIYEKVAQSSVGISSIGLTLCLIVSIICIKYWQTPIVKASGKETSIILFLGIILSYISGELILALSPSVFICNFSIFSVGFCITLTYSAIFARSSRINAIFQINELQFIKSQKISGQTSQFLIIGVFCLIQFIVLVIICSVTPVTPHLILSDYELRSQTTMNENSITIYEDDFSHRIINHQNQLILHGLPNNLMLCFPYFNIKQIITIFIPLILMCLSTVYAYKIRKVPSGFNEARALAFVNYINCICFITTPILMYYAQKTILELVPLSFLLISTATNEFTVLILPKVYIILFRPYKNTRASIMQRLRGLSQVECMEWINEVKSRSPPGIFSISKGKVSTPWLKIHELSSKSLGAPTSTVPNPTILNKKTSKPIEKCLINEFSCGTSVITYDYTKASDKQVHENNSSSFRMKPKIVPFTENLNLDETNKESIIFHEVMGLCTNDDCYQDNNNDNTNKF
ncbi:Metabotropic glutamate receptor 7 [Schistosoma japonicum]|nr:Metabotropic glutamate receptor 7 [Schistosoma japonicum]